MYFSSQNSTGNDDGWNGFESQQNQGKFNSQKSLETSDTTTSKSRSMKVTSKTVAEDDLLSLDVKASKKSSGKVAKKPEDDIWEMLNN